MYIDTAKEVAEERHALLQWFADVLEDEIISVGDNQYWECLGRADPI